MNRSAKIVDDDNLMTPDRFRVGHPHSEWRILRQQCPVYLCEPKGYRPFWAITKYADIREVEERSDVFVNEPRFVVMPETFENYMAEKFGSQNGLLRLMAQMDGDEHRKQRAVLQPWFTPKHLRTQQSEIEQMCDGYFDRLRENGREGIVDFAQGLGFWYPLRVVCSMMGLSETEDPKIWEMSQSLLAFKVPESDSEAVSGWEAVHDYFRMVVEDRKARPRDDLSTYLANAAIDGKPLDAPELLAHFLIVSSAGHDTTSSAITGGIKALIENPVEFDKLRQDPSLLGSAVEEVLRWVTPTIQFCRTATRDYVLRGQLIRKGEFATLLFSSGNRDEEVFDEPDRFKVDRTPNKHLAFGFGPHTCLGVSLARLEIATFLRTMMNRFEHLEIAGPTPCIAANLVTRLESLPVRYRFKQ